ncbi:MULTISPECIES: effector-associated domain EAD1-containing protein [unclassified Mesorhizobium]|uniref:effector-associated domain EAD1-containing protein n=1 Tax=unclassified Mesorhizobium TaxID=325217 RepID=UPI0033378F43
MADPAFDDAAIDALRDALVTAFASEDDLYDMALTGLDINIYKIVGQGPPLNVFARQLLVGLKERGWVTRFLRAARKSRPQNYVLIAEIKLRCSGAMLDEDPVGPRVGELVKALEFLGARKHEAPIAAAIGPQKINLRALDQGLVRLRAYKNLHDMLQNIQVYDLADFLRLARSVRDDPTVMSDLRAKTARFKQGARKAETTLSPLKPLENKHQEQKKWIDDFKDALARVDAGLDNLDDRAALRGALAIRLIVKDAPPIINREMREEAKDLPLDALGAVLAGALASAVLDEPTKRALTTGAESVDDLRQRLGRRVREHDRWQDVERELWQMDDIVERGSLGSRDDFEAYWQNGKDGMVQLWNADPGAAWAVETSGLGNAIDTLLAAAVEDVIEQSSDPYRRFRKAALDQFFEVDAALLELCEEIPIISGPVAAIAQEGP